VLVLVITFLDPFLTAVGNGYYSCLFALLASFGLLVSLRRADQESSGPNATAQSEEDRETLATAMFFVFMRGLMIASLVVLVSSSLVCRDNGGCQGNIQRFQVAVGAVSLFFTLIIVLLELVGVFRVAGVFKTVISLVLLLYWIAGFIVLTFYGSFQSPTIVLPIGSGTNNGDVTPRYANGFFFTWVGVICAALAFAEALKDHARLSDPPNPLVAKTGFLLVIMGGSAIELGAALKYYYDTSFSSLSIYAISLGVSSIGLVFILFLILLCTQHNYTAHDTTYNAMMYLLTLWWALGALILTFDGLWPSAVNNGYFSTFFTLGTCLLALSGVWRTGDEDDYLDSNANTSTRNTNAPVYRDVEAGQQPNSGAVARY